MKRVLVLVVALGMVVAACGDDDGSAGGVASLDAATAESGDQVAGEGTAEDVDIEEAVLAFSQCLRDEGFDVVDPEFDDEGGFVFEFREQFRSDDGTGPDQEFQTAIETCQVHMEGVAQEFGRPDLSEIEDDLLAFAECMRDNGVDMPDPDLSGIGEGAPGGGRVFGDIDISDPQVEIAFEECQSELAFGGPGGPGGPGGGRGNTP